MKSAKLFPLLDVSSQVQIPISQQKMTLDFISLHLGLVGLSIACCFQLFQDSAFVILDTKELVFLSDFRFFIIHQYGSAFSLILEKPLNQSQGQGNQSKIMYVTSIRTCRSLIFFTLTFVSMYTYTTRFINVIFFDKHKTSLQRRCPLVYHQRVSWFILIFYVYFLVLFNIDCVSDLCSTTFFRPCLENTIRLKSTLMKGS